MRFSQLLLLLSLSVSESFVVRPATVARSPTTNLHWMEPSSILEGTSNLISAIDAPPEVGGISYSRASYYTILGLYLMSFPGIWSQITRSTKAKVKRKTFVTPGENADDGKSLRQQAGEIMACKSPYQMEMDVLFFFPHGLALYHLLSQT